MTCAISKSRSASGLKWVARSFERAGFGILRNRSCTATIFKRREEWESERR